jgi:hypothetical protein
MSGYEWVGYITGASASSTIARMEMVNNFEALVDNVYGDYLPSESPNESVDPRDIGNIISKLKHAGSVISPATFEKAIQNSGVVLQDQIELPLPREFTKIKKDNLQDLLDVVKEVAKVQTKPMNYQHRSNWLTTIMDMVSPLTSAAIQAAAGLLPMNFKF